MNHIVEILDSRAVNLVAKPRWTEHAKDIIDKLLEKTDALTAYVLVKHQTEIGLEMIKLLKEGAIKNLPGKGTINIFGAECRIKRLPTVYQYEDVELGKLEKQLDTLKEKISARKKLLQSPVSKDLVSSKTGAQLVPAKIIESGATIEVTFK